MIFLNRTIYFIFLASICSTFSSCSGQQTFSTPEKSVEIGITVAQLDSTIWTIYQDKNSNYWFGSKENGVYYYNGQHLKHITVKDGLASNEIRQIQEDSKGNMYFETEQGISKFDGKTFNTLHVEKTVKPATDWTLEPDDLWFRSGFNDNGVYRFDGEYLHYLKFPKAPKEDEFKRKNNNLSIQPYGLYTLYKDRKGVMWFGTASLGLCHFDGKTLSWYYEEQLQTTPKGGDFGTRAIFEDKQGKYWINNTRFRYKLKPNTNINIDFKQEKGIGYLDEKNTVNFPFFLAITDDDDGNLWMVTHDNGVWKYNGKKLLHYPVLHEQKKVMLFTIYKDKQGVLWLGSHNAGVFKFNGQTFEKFVN
jgi:ligand-binding sensor domain-containing protein